MSKEVDEGLEERVARYEVYMDFADSQGKKPSAIFRDEWIDEAGEEEYSAWMERKIAKYQERIKWLAEEFEEIKAAKDKEQQS